MKCQNLFSGENKKNISICPLLKILPIMLSVKVNGYTFNGSRYIDVLHLFQLYLNHIEMIKE